MGSSRRSVLQEFAMKASQRGTKHVFSLRHITIHLKSVGTHSLDVSLFIGVLGPRSLDSDHIVAPVRLNLTSIQDSNGVVHRGQKQIAHVAQEYFQSLFGNTIDNSRLYTEVFGTFQKIVTMR